MKLVFAEFVGTFLLTSVVLGTNSNNPIGFFAPFLGLALALQVSVPTLGHVNPAVSVAMLVAGELKPKDFGMVVPAQFLGALLAALTNYIVSLPNIHHGRREMVHNAYAGLPDANYSNWVGVFESFLASFIFILAIFAITDPKNAKLPDYLIRIYVPLSLMAVVGTFGNGEVNPAVNWSPRLFSLIAFGTKGFFDHDAFCLVYLFMPMVGGAVAALFYKLYQKIVFTKEDNEEQLIQ